MESPAVSKRKRVDSDDSIDDESELSFKLSNRSVLDCPVCFNPLTVPVFQCANGHIVCKTCHAKVKPKCPTCSVKLGNSRNRAIESVVESIKVSCSYKNFGCAKELNFSTKVSHVETCAYAPYECLFKDCNFLGSPTKLYVHLKAQHRTSVILLRSCSSSRYGDFSASKNDEVVVFLELGDDNEGAIFILNPRMMRISCIQEPKISKYRVFTYSLTALHRSGSFEFKPNVVPLKNIAGSDNASKDLLQILDNFYDHDERINLKISVHGYLRN